MRSILSVNALARSYNTQRLWKDVTFSINPGEKVAIVGRNGSGKSTLIHCLCGLTKPDSGEIIFSRPIMDIPGYNRVSHLSQFPRLQPGLKVRELITLFDMMFPGIMTLISESSLHERVIAFKNKTFDTLSGGEQRVLLVGLTLAKPSELVFLDEPASGLDYDMAEETGALIAKSPKTVLFVSHELNDAVTYSHRVFCLYQKRLHIFDSSKDKTEISTQLKRIIKERKAP